MAICLEPCNREKDIIALSSSIAMYRLTFSQTCGKTQPLYTYWWPSISITFQWEMSLVMFDLTQSKKRGSLFREGEIFFTKTVSFSWFFALSLWRHDQVPAKHQFDQNSHCQAALRAPSQTSDNGEVFQQKIFLISPSYFCKENVDILWVFCSLQMNERWDNDWYRGPTNIPRSEMPPKAYLLFVLIREK